jgi:hypothetical protein
MARFLRESAAQSMRGAAASPILRTMPRQDALFALMRSMSAREKQHFKREAKTHRNAAGYVALFDEIAARLQASDAALQEQLKAQFGQQKLALRKQYLFDALSRSLLGTRSTHQVAAQVEFKVQQARLLYERDVHQQAIKAAKKAEQLALDIHRYDLQWQALNVQRLTMAAMRSKLSRKEQVEAVLARMEVALQRQMELQQAMTLYYRAFDRIWRKDKEAAEDLRRDLEESQRQGLLDSPHALASAYALSAWSQYHHAEQDYARSESLLLKLQALFDREPGILESLPAWRITVAHNLANRAILRLDWANVAQAIERIQQVPKGPGRIEIKRYTGLVELCFQYAARTGQALEGSAWQEVQDDWERMLPRIGAIFRIDARLKRSIYAWCLGHSERAVVQLNRLLGGMHDAQRLPAGPSGFGQQQPGRRTRLGAVAQIAQAGATLCL